MVTSCRWRVGFLLQILLFPLAMLPLHTGMHVNTKRHAAFWYYGHSLAAAVLDKMLLHSIAVFGAEVAETIWANYGNAINTENESAIAADPTTVSLTYCACGSSQQAVCSLLAQPSKQGAKPLPASIMAHL